MVTDVEDTECKQPLMCLKGFAKRFYRVLFVLTLAFAVASIFIGDVENLVLTVPIVVMMGIAIFTEKEFVHIPPVLIMMMIGTFALSQIGRMISGASVVECVSNFLIGVNFGLLGLIMIYILLKSMPGVRDENPKLSTLFVMSLSLSLFTLMKMLQFFLSEFVDNMDSIEIGDMMLDSTLVIIGSLVVCVMYYEDEKRDIFRYTLRSFLDENSEYLGIKDREKEDALHLISKGESETLEFKSTLRTNLQTGETDKRMEKAVLKTLVAFLNTDGGTLFIGVADDGSIRGADLESFENKDKLGLHLKNLISSQIGDGFLPYISSSMMDFDDKVVIRVKCLSCPVPVFLKEGKTELYFARSGPSSTELTGMTLINYVNNRQKEMVRKGRVFD